MTREQEEQLHALKVPTDSCHPDHSWIACVDREGDAPTPQEAAMVRSFIEYVVGRIYTEAWRERLLSMPLPEVEGANTIVFLKRGDGEWLFRVQSWSHGYVPFAGEGKRLTLGQCMDRERIFGKAVQPSWVEWKRDHPETFPPAD